MSQQRRSQLDEAQGEPSYAAIARSRLFTNLAAVVVLVTVTLLVFGQAWRFTFVNWDDDKHIFRNPYLNPVNQDHLKQLWKEPYQALYIPVSYMSFALQTYVSRWWQGIGPTAEPSPVLFHVVSLVLHLICVLLVWRLLVRLVGRPWPALLGALLFAIHPMQAESVAWVSEQRGLLGTFFCLLAITWYLWFAQSTGPTWRRAVSYICGLLAFALALLCKPSAAALPLIIAAIDYWCLRRKPWPMQLMSEESDSFVDRLPWHIAVPLLPWFVLLGVALAVTKWVQPNTIIDDAAMMTLSRRPFVAGDAATFYIVKLVAPVRLAIDYGRMPKSVLKETWPYIAPFVIGAALIVIFAWGKLRAWRAPTALFFLALLPVLGFIPFAYQNISTVADRYMYMALLGPALGVALLLARWPKPWMFGICMVVLAMFAFLAQRQAATWKDPLSLYKQALSVYQGNASIHYNRGNELLKDPDRTQDALLEYREAVDLDPKDASARYNLSVALQKAGQNNEALWQCMQASKLDPYLPEAHYSLAGMYHMQGKNDLAMAEYILALTARPKYPEALNNFGKLLTEQGKIDDAKQVIKRAIELKPDFADAYVSLGIALATEKNWDEAIACMHVALKLQKDHPGALELLPQIERMRQANP